MHRRPAFTKWRDLHALSGLVLAAVLALIAFTGAYYAYRSTATAVLTLASGNAALPAPRVSEPQPGDTVSLQELWDAARRAEPVARFDELRPARLPTGSASASFRYPGDHVPGRNRMFLDPYTGRVLRTDRFEEQPASVRFAGNMGPWHFGSWGGRPTQWLWFVAGFAPAFLFATGAWMWWRRSVRPRQLVRAQASGSRQVQ